MAARCWWTVDNHNVTFNQQAATNAAHQSKAKALAEWLVSGNQLKGKKTWQ